MGTQRIFAAGVEILLLLLSLSARESFKAWTAERCGDATGRLLGRVSLNPLRHLELMGSIILPVGLVIFGFPVFGWGRPVPLLEKNLRDPYRDGLLIAAAGPLCSFVLTLLGIVALFVAVDITGKAGALAARDALLYQWAQVASPHFPLMFTLSGLVRINLLLLAFHLIPLPQLDGGRIVYHLLPPDWAEKFAALPPIGFMIGLALSLIVLVMLALILLSILGYLIQFAA